MDSATERPPREWTRAVGLLFIVLAMSVVRPGVLIGVPLLMLLVVSGLRSPRGVAAAVLATVIIATGARDGIWYAERAWSVLLGGGFVALTLLRPAWTLSARALATVSAATALAGALLVTRADAWMALDAAFAETIRGGFGATIAAMSALGGEGSMSPSFESWLLEVAEAQASVYPAFLGLGSMAALGVAWWARTRLTDASEPGLGRLRNFRFNDHLVWLLVAGLLLLLLQWGEALARVGSNAVVFMGALYALRGAAVFVFVSGGLSLFGYVTFVVGLLLAAPVLVGAAMLIGVGDTWLDIRSRAEQRAA